MKSNHGGYMPVYNMEAVEMLMKSGWIVVPEGEWPNPPLTAKQANNKTSPAQLAANKRYYDKKRAEKLK